jgi:hypothetical protein
MFYSTHARRLALLFCLTDSVVSRGSLIGQAQQSSYETGSLNEVTTLTPGATRRFQGQSGDSVPLNTMWSATGGTVDANGVYIAGGEPGVYRVIAMTPGGLADTAMVTIVASLGRAVATDPLSPSDQKPAPVRERFGVNPEATDAGALEFPDSIVLSPSKLTVLAGKSFQFRLQAFKDGLAYPYSEGEFRAQGGSVTREGFFLAGTQPGKFPVVFAGRGGMLDTAWVYVAPAWLTLPSIPAILIPFLLNRAWDRFKNGGSKDPPSRGTGMGNFDSQWRTAVVSTRGWFGSYTHREALVLALLLAPILVIAKEKSLAFARLFR